jgi:hypothetical protein
VRTGEIDAVAKALGEGVVAVRPLAGGFSHETCLLTLAGGERVVARLGGADPAIEAAVMLRGGTRVPVPRVLRVAAALDWSSASLGAEDWDSGGGVPRPRWP